MPRWDAKVDANQPSIVQALRDAYCSVLPIHRVGQGAPDLAVGYQGGTYFLEIKTDKGKLTPAEIEFMDAWRGHYAIVRTVDEALRAIGVLEEMK
ncbi:hypothetical protein LCGC14_2304080 [marine sediment metagenome]|uniref:VRR-NUC domain-containing protein n=1 Tax=marine sediment metagenome TaxID=412755 RepID=A0A0F9EZZ8_9ZZZZ